MDRLSLVTAAFEQFQNEPKVFSMQGVQGVGIGFEDEKTLEPGGEEQYAFVYIVQDGISSFNTSDIPDSYTCKLGPGSKLSGGILASSSEIPESIDVKIRVERKEIVLLDVELENAEPLEVSSSSVFTGGDAIYNSSGRWIGTGGLVMKIGGKSCIVSNEHVLKIAGIQQSITNKGRQTIGRVNWLRQNTDSGTALLATNSYSNNIPGIGKPNKVAGGINVGWYGKKRGSATGLTDFHIRWWGNLNGNTSVIGSNMGGWDKVVVGKGDSGSVVVGNNGDVTALVYAGNNEIGKGPGGATFSEIICLDITVAFHNPKTI